MKIIGITYYDGSENVVLKSDSSMLVNRKPLFVPETTSDLQVLPCWVLRVSRLGRCVAPRFAARYYDAVAPGCDFFAADLLREAKAAGKPWTEAMAFEGSLAFGKWQVSEAPALKCEWQLQRAEERVEEQTWSGDLQEVFAQALARASRMLTIRQGDLIYVALQQTPWQLQANDLLRCVCDGEELLYCKIK